MRIFIDESGTFTGANNISAVGALIIPDKNFGGFQKLYGRLRPRLPQEKGEVKGRLLAETDVRDVVQILYKLGCLFEVVVVDSSMYTLTDIMRHKEDQEKKVTENLTDQHHKELVEKVWLLRNQLENTPLQLYVQACAMAELVYNTIYHSTLYYSFRIAKELGEYHWILDAKGGSKPTAWENWWSEVISPMIESKSFKNPFAIVKGGNYRWHDRFRVEPNSYKRQFISDTEYDLTFDIQKVLKESLRFSCEPEYGLEAADILTNAVRRSLVGNFTRPGWLPIRTIMVHWKQHYIRLASFSTDVQRHPNIDYKKVIYDFTRGGRSMRPRNY